MKKLDEDRNVTQEYLDYVSNLERQDLERFYIGADILNNELQQRINKISKKLEITLNCIKNYMVENEEYIRIHTDYIYALEEQIEKLKGVDKK